MTFWGKMIVMELFAHISRDRLHHAYLIEATPEAGVAAVLSLFEEWGIRTSGNADVRTLVFDTLFIDDAHDIRKEERYFPVNGSKKIFVIAFNVIHHDAQNALLKTIEEPTENTHFFFVTRTREALLPTVRSRMQLIAGAVADGLGGGDEGKEFLRASIPERFKMIEPMTKAKAEERGEAREDARKLLDAIERALCADLKRRQEFAPSLAHVLFAKTALAKSAPSLKLLLEHLALTTPAHK